MSALVRTLAVLVCALPTYLATPSQAQTAAQTAELPIIADQARIKPVLARNGMVVAQEERAARIGVAILQKGGNAVDAAAAVGFALAVTHPQAGNLGGGGFMLIHLQAQKRTVAIDYRETAPSAATPDMFLDADGKFLPERSQHSGDAVGVPGSVAGLALAQAKYGSGRLTLADVLAPAIALARDGIEVRDDLADSLPHAARRMARYPSSRAIFLHPDGSAFARGETLVQTDLAHTLSTIAEQGPRGFYEGEIAQKIVSAVQANGGRISLADLATYTAIEREPVRGTYRGHEIVSMPPPSSGGVHLIELLNMLEGFPLAALGSNSAQTIHLEAEAMKLAYADRARWLGDPDFVASPIKGLTSKAYADTLRAQISATRVRPVQEIMPGNPLPYESDQTTHFSVVDGDGNAVSNTYTLNFSYGLGLVADGTGVLLNNEMDDFAAREDAPNAFGLLGGKANAPAPRKRPLSSMTPTMMFKDGALELVTGTPGGARIITTVLQIILNVVDHQMNIAEASDAVRVHHQGNPDELRVERGLSPDTQRVLENMGHRVVTRETMGSVQSILRTQGWLMGAADQRQRGTGAVGY